MTKKIYKIHFQVSFHHYNIFIIKKNKMKNTSLLKKVFGFINLDNPETKVKEYTDIVKDLNTLTDSLLKYFNVKQWGAYKTSVIVPLMGALTGAVLWEWEKDAGIANSDFKSSVTLVLDKKLVCRADLEFQENVKTVFSEAELQKAMLEAIKNASNEYLINILKATTNVLPWTTVDQHLFEEGRQHLSISKTPRTNRLMIVGEDNLDAVIQIPGFINNNFNTSGKVDMEATEIGKYYGFTILVVDAQYLNRTVLFTQKESAAIAIGSDVVHQVIDKIDDAWDTVEKFIIPVKAAIVKPERIWKANIV